MQVANLCVDVALATSNPAQHAELPEQPRRQWRLQPPDDAHGPVAFSRFQRHAPAGAVRIKLARPHEELELPTVARALQIAPAARGVRACAVLCLPMEAVGADRIVVVRDAVVVTLALVQRDEEQLGLALGQGQHPGLEWRPP